MPDRPPFFAYAASLRTTIFPGMLVLLKWIGGIQHESSFENTRRAARRCSRDYHLDIRVFVKPVLGRVWHRRDVTRHLRRYRHLHDLRHKRDHRSRYRFPRQPLWFTYAGGVAAGAITAAAVCRSGQNLWMKNSWSYGKM